MYLLPLQRHTRQTSLNTRLPMPDLEEQNPIFWKDFLEHRQQVLSYFTTYSPPELRQLSYHETNFCIPCRRPLPPENGTTHCETDLRLSVIRKTLTMTGQEFLGV